MKKISTFILSSVQSKVCEGVPVMGSRGFRYGGFSLSVFSFSESRPKNLEDIYIMFIVLSSVLCNFRGQVYNVNRKYLDGQNGCL